MAELALAVIPLCMSALKGIRLIHKKLKILRHRDKEIKRLRTRFTSQTDIFLDECQLLFQGFLDHEDADAIVGNVQHELWTSPNLDGQLQRYLGRKYDRFQETVAEIKQHIYSLAESLDQPIESNGGQNVSSVGNEKKTKIFERASEAMDIMMNKSKYGETIDDLKEAIQEFKRIRKMAAKVHKHQSATSSCIHKRARPLPSSYRRTTEHLRSFYEALRYFWSCAQTQHTGHDVRLFLDSRSDGSLRVIVRYRTESSYKLQEYVHLGLQSPILCIVRLTIIDFRKRSGLVDLMVQSQNLRLIRISIPPTAGEEDSVGVEQPRKKARVRMADHCADASSSSTINMASGGSMTQTISIGKVSATEGAALNLCSVKDLCSHLCSRTRTNLGPQDQCTGYLDTSDDLRHFLCPIRNPEECLSSKVKSDPTTLDQVLNLPVERTISVAEQLRLALKLVRAVLQFHATPWLKPLWHLQDLAYFQTDEGLSASLSTLHISTELVRRHPQQRDPHDALMVDIDRLPNGKASSSEHELLVEAQRECGIRNLTMHSLGVALLQIGQWDPLRPDNIVEIRRVADLAASGSRLGPRYQRLTQKCLECDFGFGKDLAQPELQGAVYRDVACELEELISSLEGPAVRD